MLEESHDFSAALNLHCINIVISAQDTVSDLKERVRVQYRTMHALLEANQAETEQMLGNTFTVFVRKNSQQALQLNDKRREAEKLLSSMQMFFHRSDSINFMKVRAHSSVSATCKVFCSIKRWSFKTQKHCHTRLEPLYTSCPQLVLRVAVSDLCHIVFYRTQNLTSC